MADIYIDADVAPEADDLLSDAIDTIRTTFPEWQPSEADFAYIVLSVCAQMVAVAYEVAGLVPEALFRWFGASLVNLPPVAAQQASGTVTIDVKDALGYTVPDSTIFALQAAGDEDVAFATVGDTVIPPGATAAAGVLITAVNSGANGSGLSVVDLAKSDPLDFITAVTVDGETTGGTDDEENDAYLNRLSKLLETMTPRPILPDDFAIIVRENIASVYRSVALAGYDPVTNTWNNTKTVAVAVMGADGGNVSLADKNAAAALLEAEREVNFVVSVIDPTRSQIDVEYVATAYAGQDLVAAKQAVADALAGYLDPLTWGDEVGEGEAPGWTNTAKARVLEIATVIENVPSINTLETLLIGLHLGARANADINLPGAAPVATLGDIIGTVNAP